jgi:hypothetical protein
MPQFEISTISLQEVQMQKKELDILLNLPWNSPSQNTIADAKNANSVYYAK